MTLPAFDLLQPTSLAEALDALASTPDARPIAGGTSLLVNLRDGRETIGCLVDLGRVNELRGIDVREDELILGALTPVAALIDSPLVAKHTPILRDAAMTFASPLVRNRATVSGNLADASPAADMAPPLLAMGARLDLASTEGTRSLPLDAFFLGVRRTALRPSELIAAIRIPVGEPDLRTGYRKLGLRKADAISVISVAVAAAIRDGRCSGARIALGAVAPIPLLAESAGAGLEGQTLTPEAIANAAARAAEACSPIDDVRSTATYRERTVETLVRRLLTGLAEGGAS